MSKTSLGFRNLRWLQKLSSLLETFDGLGTPLRYLKHFYVSELYFNFKILRKVSETFLRLRDLPRLQKLFLRFRDLLRFQKHFSVSNTFLGIKNFLGFRNLPGFQKPYWVSNTFLGFKYNTLFDFRNFAYVQKPSSALEVFNSFRTFSGSQTSSKGNLLRFQKYSSISKTSLDSRNLRWLQRPSSLLKTVYGLGAPLRF